MPDATLASVYLLLLCIKLILFSLPVLDEDLLTLKWGEFLPKQWQIVTQKVGKVLPHFLLPF